MSNKPNDFFATLMFQPNTTFEDMAAEGLTADNLGLQSRDYYKDIQQVKDTFVGKDGRLIIKHIMHFMIIVYHYITNMHSKIMKN
jgi:hypothetical protein